GGWPGWHWQICARARQTRKDRIVVSLIRTAKEWERYAWLAGIVFVIALVAEIVVAIGVELSQNDSAAKIANGLHAHETRLIVIACLSVVYAVMFVIYLSALHNLLRGDTDRT